MDLFFTIYELFNQIEGLLWIAIALALPFVIRASERRQRVWLFLASAAFVAFGISDFFEATTRRGMPGWLWAYEISLGGFLLVCRFGYLGWARFRWADRFVLFGLGCFVACLVAIGLQIALYAS